MATKKDDLELERAKERMLKHRARLHERAEFTMSLRKMDDKGVIVGVKQTDKQEKVKYLMA